jgi:hypothetical protein
MLANNKDDNFLYITMFIVTTISILCEYYPKGNVSLFALIILSIIMTLIIILAVNIIFEILHFIKYIYDEEKNEIIIIY